MNIMTATKITGTTLVCSYGKFPRDNGNCFDVEANDGKQYRIVNFYCENLEEAVKRGIIFPIKILILGGNKAIIHDERIPENWYRNDYCEVCCPMDLLPHNQQMRHLRAEASGEECSKTFTSGEYVKMPMTIVSYHPEKKPDLRTREEKSEDLKNRKKMEKNFKKWKIIEKPGICIINDSAIAKVSIEKKNEKRNNG